MDCEKEIVCDFQGRRRPVVFSACEDAKEENSNLLAAVKTTFADLISPEKDSAYFLQVESKKHGLIDLINVHALDDEKVFLRVWSPNCPKDEVSRSVLSGLII